MKKLTFTIICILLCCISAEAERYYYFNRFSTAEGLPNNSITCTAQDNYGFIWIGTKDGICRFDGHEFTLVGGKGPLEPLNGVAADIEIDSDGVLWFSTTNGVGSYDPATDKTILLGQVGSSRASDIASDPFGNTWVLSNDLYRYNKIEDKLTSYGLSELQPSHVVTDNVGTVWMTVKTGGLYRYDSRRDRFEKYIVTVDGKPETNICFNRIRATSGANLIVSTTDQDVILINTGDFSGKRIFKHQFFTAKTEIYDVLERQPGEYWCGTDRGIFVFDAIEGGDQYSFIKYEKTDIHSISSESVRNLMADREGNVWIGTYFGGLNLWLNQKDTYTVFYENPSPNSIYGRIIRSIVADDDGILWIGSEDGELNRYDTLLRVMKGYDNTKGFNIQSILPDGDYLWITSYYYGVYLFEKSTGRLAKHYDLPTNNAVCLYRTRNGKILVGTSKGIYRYDKSNDSFVSFGEDVEYFIHCMTQDPKGIIWVGTFGSGLFFLDENGSIVSSMSVSDQEGSISSNYITSFALDSENRMWITTEGGGVCYSDKNYNVKDLKFSNITRDNGLPSNITSATIEDREGNIWIATAKGLMLIDPSRAGFERVYTEKSNVTGDQYSYGASYVASNGNIYLGTTNGLISFSPAKMKSNINSSSLRIMDIIASAGDKTIHLKEEGKSCLESKEVSVRYKDAASIKISFADPVYSNLSQSQYLCKFTQGKSTVTSKAKGNSIEYTSIKPGKVYFTVSLMDDDNPSSTTSIVINVKPPFYRSSFAYFLYFLGLMLVVGLVLYAFSVHNDNKRKLQMEQLERDKEREIYDAKINFFTNITHEIRTPLTLIKMPLDKLIASHEYTPAAEKDMMTVKDNANRLLDLTNQLLDLKRIEQDDMRLSFTKEDICRIVKKTCKYFERLSHDQHTEMTFNIPEECIEIMCARDAVEKIISNLMSNAMKYGNDRLDVSITPDPSRKIVVVRVNSNGEKIAESDKERIFEKFYHGGKGTGLGLAFARTLAEMHNGRLYVDPAVTDVNSFVLELPMEQPEQVIIRKDEKNDTKFVAPSSEDGNLQHILLVEDSLEFREYLADELSSEYKVSTASNGKDALEILETGKIDLVVSDIMMPVMDGCQLCNTIKTNPDYSHIPVILMTAVIGLDTRIETLEVAADSYLEKPFPIELLRATIASLFKNREIAYRQFTNSPLAHFSNVKTSKIDDEYMTKLHETIMKHLEEQDLGIETLTTILGTSKSTLYRKVKANTGLNINEYIRLCRLKKAAELLSSQKYRVNEVAYLVGFSSPSYFATCFQNQFNQSPSSFVRSLKE